MAVGHMDVAWINREGSRASNAQNFQILMINMKIAIYYFPLFAIAFHPLWLDDGGTQTTMSIQTSKKKRMENEAMA